MLRNSIQYLKGIGPAKAGALKTEAGIETIEDLFYYSPRRYIDRSSFKKIVDCFVNEEITVSGVITRISIRGRGKKFLEVVIDDGSDTLSGIFFRGINYFLKIFNKGDSVLFSGRIDFYRNKQIVHPDFDFIDEEANIKSIHTGRIVPLYPSTEKMKSYGLNSKGFRRIISSAIEQYIEYIDEPFEEEFLSRLKLVPLKEAILSLHFPENIEKAEAARERLAFNELFFMQYYLCISKKHLREEQKLEKKEITPEPYNEFKNNLPFVLTGDQEKSINEIREDLKNPFPMNRLLQGDVGSGKTAVAVAASMFALGRGEQSAVMAPTEVLASQHYRTFTALLPGNIRTSLLTGSIAKKEKNAVYESISRGEVDVIIGTHALIQEEVSFRNLGLIIIDEQHRFGVNQRAKLRQKGKSPDLLIMTATPIPRSLSLTLYGDMEVSYIKEKPRGRRPIETISFPESRLPGVYNSVEKYIGQGRQVYFVLPLIEESEKIDLKSATETYEHLKNEIFPHRRIELLHGRLPAQEKDGIMQRFKKGSIDILVSTTVIEVGIDVPNANVMIIGHPERFGLSQLHQLRGRVGRGEHKSYCILVYPDNIAPESKKRIDILTSTDDGFEIAEEDLKQRGAGEIIGLKQHGHQSGFEFADIRKDLKLILTARKEAENIVSKIEDVHEILKNIKSGKKYYSLLDGLRTKRILSILS